MIPGSRGDGRDLPETNVTSSSALRSRRKMETESRSERRAPDTAPDRTVESSAGPRSPDSFGRAERDRRGADSGRCDAAYRHLRKLHRTAHTHVGSRDRLQRPHRLLAELTGHCVIPILGLRQERSDGGISVYIPPKSVYLKNFMWLFFSYDPGQIRYDLCSHVGH